MRHKEIHIYLSDGMEVKLTDRWHDDTRCWEWDILLDCMKSGGIYILPSNDSAVNTARIVMAKVRVVYD